MANQTRCVLTRNDSADGGARLCRHASLPLVVAPPLVRFLVHVQVEDRIGVAVTVAVPPQQRLGQSLLAVVAPRPLRPAPAVDASPRVDAPSFRTVSSYRDGRQLRCRPPPFSG